MKNLFILILILILALDARGQNGVYADTNFVIWPGYTMPASQITGVGAGIFGSNSVTLDQFVFGTNKVSTNTLAVAATNTAVASNYFAGQFNLLEANNAFSGSYGDIALGGSNNVVQWPAYSSGIFAGRSNIITGQNYAAPLTEANVIAGGLLNNIQYPSYYCALVAGISNLISADWSCGILGGQQNVIQGYGFNDLILGGRSNRVQGASSSLAAGTRAQAMHDFTFVWSDDWGSPFSSVVPNTFLIHASNGVAINTNNPGTNALRVVGNVEASSFTQGGTNLLALANGSAAVTNLNFIVTNLQAAVLNLSNQLLTAINASTNNTGSNYFALHFRQGRAVVGAGTNMQAITLDTPYLDDGYRVFLTRTDLGTNPYFVFGVYTNFFILQLSGTNAIGNNFDYLTSHP